MAMPLKTADPEKVLESVVKAATGGLAFKQATKPLSQESKDTLSRAIGMDVDVWRQEFGVKLREAGDELLALLREKAPLIKPDALAYSLAVVVDKSASLDGRNALQSASVNIQVNNYGTNPRDSLMDELKGLGKTNIVRQTDSKHPNRPNSGTDAIDISASVDATKSGNGQDRPPTS